MDDYAFALQQERSARLMIALGRARALLTYDDKWLIDRSFRCNGRLAAGLRDSDGDTQGAALAATLQAMGVTLEDVAPIFIAALLTAQLPATDPAAALRERLSRSLPQPGTPEGAETPGMLDSFMNMLAEGGAAIGVASVTRALLSNPTLINAIASRAAAVPEIGPLLYLGVRAAQVVLPAVAGGAAAEAVAGAEGHD